MWLAFNTFGIGVPAIVVRLTVYKLGLPILPTNTSPGCSAYVQFGPKLKFTLPLHIKSVVLNKVTIT